MASCASCGDYDNGQPKPAITRPSNRDLAPAEGGFRFNPGLIEYGEQGMASGAMPIRIASSENPLGPGQHVLDAIVGKFPEAHRYPFNARQTEGALIRSHLRAYRCDSVRSVNTPVGQTSTRLPANGRSSGPS